MPSNSNAKKSHSTMDKPIPLALSRVRMEHNIANEINTMVINTPILIIIIPTDEKAYITTGMPVPTKKAKVSARLKPA